MAADLSLSMRGTVPKLTADMLKSNNHQYAQARALSWKSSMEGFGKYTQCSASVSRDETHEI